MTELPSSYNVDAPVYSTPTGPADTLPTYDDSGSPSAVFHPSRAINDKLPNHFKINAQHVESQVMPSDLEAHLVLLGAFNRLREEVRTVKEEQEDVTMRPDERYAVFLQRAVHRFEEWAVRMIGCEGDEDNTNPQDARALATNEVPPLDVIMVWHTYMLNPRTYYEDCLRYFHGLLKIGSFPLAQLAGTIDQETLLPHPPTTDRAAAFEAFTGQSFAPPISTTSQHTLVKSCPSCSVPNKIQWITHLGNGYAQRGFTHTCGKCKFEFNRETLGVRKFLDDIEKCSSDPEKYFLANTVVDHQSGVPVDSQFSTALSDIVGGINGVRGARAEDLGVKVGWTMRAVEDYCRAGMLGKRNKPFIPTPRPLNIIMSAYRVPGPSSIDLASAVIRQMNFVEKMVQLGFTEPGRWEEDNDTLTRCVVRYHHFLDLISSTAGKFAVPTLDIDLAWHTHQLLCDSYRKLKDLIGIVPDHDDKVGQGALSDAYDRTAESWKERFGVPYSVCGCLPPEKALNITKGSCSSFLNFSKKGKSKSAAETPFDNPRPDLVLLTDGVAEQTHPSDHNAVAIINPAESNMAQAQVRRRELEKRAKVLGKAAEKGKADQ